MMNSILATEKYLPPGLWLPTADESTDQYLVENFNHNNHDYEDIVDYGMFIVALAVIGAPETKRVNFMPTQNDFVELFAAGYGIQRMRLARYYGGEAKLQKALKFYPKGYIPKKEELLERFEWMGSHKQAIALGTSDAALSTKDIIQWGATRNLTPSREIVYKVFEGDTSVILPFFSAEKPNAKKHYTANDLYRFGAQVVHENGGSLERADLGEKYSDAFIGETRSVIKAFFTNQAHYWLEFGLVPNASGLTKATIADLGVRLRIRNGKDTISRSDIDELSADNRFPSMFPIRRHFTNLEGYNVAVDDAFNRYVELRESLIENAVAPELIDAACLRYEDTEDFHKKLVENSALLAKVSAKPNELAYICSIIRNGFNLLDIELFKLQLEDFNRALHRAKIRSKEDRSIVFNLVPRISYDDLEEFLSTAA